MQSKHSNKRLFQCTAEGSYTVVLSMVDKTTIFTFSLEVKTYSLQIPSGGSEQFGLDQF